MLTASNICTCCGWKRVLPFTLLYKIYPGDTDVLNETDCAPGTLPMREILQPKTNTALYTSLGSGSTFAKTFAQVFIPETNTNQEQDLATSQVKLCGGMHHLRRLVIIVHERCYIPTKHKYMIDTSVCSGERDGCTRSDLLKSLSINRPKQKTQQHN